MQSKLLRVIQEQEVVRVGGRTPIAIDVRFVAATHRNLEQMVTDGEFRHDLYHRLNVVKLTMPRLAEHAEDIPLLTQHFIEQINRQFKREVEGFDSESMASLMHYSWPGNVRELRNLIERHVALANGNRLHLDAPLAAAPTPQELTKDQPTLAQLEQRYILQVLAENQNSRERTARVLGINKSTLWRKLRQYGAETPSAD
jgi:DNA-binding NtrC family response regulator